MATINITVSSPTEGAAWSGSIVTSSALSAVVNGDVANITNISSTYSGSSISFTPTQFRFFPASGNNYVSWRSVTEVSQYPTTGRSLDIWSDTLYNDIIFSSATWNDLITNSAAANGGAGYALNSGKWSLTYDYDYPYAAAWSKGGFILFS